MRRAGVAAAAAALTLAACPDEGVDEPEPDAPDEPELEAEEDVEPEVEVEEDVAPDDLPAQDMFGIGFEGLWHFHEVTEVAVLVDPDAAVDEVADDLAEEDGVASVEAVDEGEADDRGELDVLQPPDEPAPAVLLVVADDHAAATQLTAAEEHPDVQHVLAPTCDALAGTARLGGTDQAQALLDDAGCDQPVIIDAEAEVDRSWVAAAGVEDGEICIGTAAARAAMSTCTGDPADPQMPVATGAGGFVVGFAPPQVETVEIEHAGQSATVEPLTVAEDAARAYAAFLPPGNPGDEVVDAPDIAEVDWRFLDAAGEVVDEG